MKSIKFIALLAALYLVYLWLDTFFDDTNVHL